VEEQENKLESLREVVYRQLKEDIIYGRINPGEKMLEMELAERFKVSRTPIREALLQLEKRGFVTHEKNVGAVVRKTSLKRLEEYFDLIAILEQHAVEFVARQKSNTESVTYLKGLLREMKGLVKERDYSGYLGKDHEFHTFFAKECGNDTLYTTVSDLRDRIFGFLERGYTLPRHIDLYLDLHQKVIEAVAEQKASQAGRLMRDHVMHAKKFILKEQVKG
jgi:DNA-binding GntR family transcriptional regulator